MAQKRSRAEQWAQDREREFLAAHEQFATPLFRHCFIRIRDREVAKDIVQETYSRVWLYLSKGNEITHMRAFLYRVANNLIVDGSRKKKSASLDAMMEEDGFEVIDETTSDPADKTSIREAMKLLRSLDEIYRSAITMRYIDQMSPMEIADTLGVSENVVSVRIHRGIERLKALMNKEPPKAPSDA